MKVKSHSFIWFLSGIAFLSLAGCLDNGSKNVAPQHDANQTTIPTGNGSQDQADETNNTCLKKEGPPEDAGKQDAWPQRIVAIGDLHGDLTNTRKVLRKAGAIDENDRWIGGSLVVVQTGDRIDRGSQDRAVIDLLLKLKAEAQIQGGAVHLLNGNHEVFNVQLNFAYVDSNAWDDFAEFATDSNDPQLLQYPQAQQGRVAAFRPGGQYAKAQAAEKTVLVLKDTVFVHGGLLPWHLEYGIDNINNQISEWMRGQAKEPIALVFLDYNYDAIDEDGPIWDRNYSYDPTEDDCRILEQTLKALSAKRMVVGHTVQSGINAACNCKVWRIDTGISDYYGGPIESLEITDLGVSIIR